MDHDAPPLVIIGHVESSLTDAALAPKQGNEGSPQAWLVFRPSVRDGLSDLREGDEVIVLTWLDRADRRALRVRGTTSQSLHWASSAHARPTGRTRLDCIGFGSFRSSMDSGSWCATSRRFT